jgi:fatty acid amide hydrolase
VRETFAGLGAQALAESIASGALTAREVVEAHIERIEAVNARLNAVVVPLFDSARAEADAVDELRRRHASLPPLAGVPFTVKECFDVAGTPTTVGLTDRRNHRASTDADVVSRMRSAGAVLLGKTNVSQLLMFNETDNPLYGRTNNPWNLDRAPGGSSGGEAAIVAAGGSALGIGSDVGGSVRLPAHACGLHAIRPTSKRLSLRGHAAMCPGQDLITIQPGPIARSSEDLELALRVLAEPTIQPSDSNVVPVPLRPSAEVHVERLRVAFFVDNGIISPAPALERAVREAVSALGARGVTVEEWRPPDAVEAWELYMALLFADGGVHYRRLISHSKKDWRVRQLLLGMAPPHSMLVASAPLFALLGQRRFAAGLRRIGRRSVAAYWELVERRSDYVRRFFRSFDEGRYDAIVCPPDAVPALRHGSGFLLGECLSYETLPVLLGMPAGVVAATRVRAGEESRRRSRIELIDRAVAKVESGSEGLPVGVQVIGRHWREDVVFALMRVLEGHFRQQPEYPAPPTLDPLDAASGRRV